jgi:hypothetical protein
MSSISHDDRFSTVYRYFIDIGNAILCSLSERLHLLVFKERYLQRRRRLYFVTGVLCNRHLENRKNFESVIRYIKIYVYNKLMMSTCHPYQDCSFCVVVFFHTISNFFLNPPIIMIILYVYYGRYQQ